MSRHLFSVFDVTRQVFFETPSSLGIVNLKPLRPGHVLIISKRVVPRLADLRPNEVSDLFNSVQSVGRVIEKAYKAEALNIAVQDGVAAGQSVPHVHVHIIPRTSKDFGGDTDRVYPALEKSEKELKGDLKDHAEGKTPTTIAEAASRVASNVSGDRDAAETHREAAIAAARKKRETEGWQVPRDEDRKPRSQEEMQKEADWLRGLMEQATALPN